MLIKIVNVDVSHTKTAKGGYDTAEVTYKSERGDVKVKKVISFANPSVFNLLKSASNGEDYEITAVKNDKDFIEWTSATKADGSAPATTGSAAKPTGKVLGSTYETADERALRQRLIVRQSSLAQAVELWTSQPIEGRLSEGDILDTAERFAEWVFEKPDLFDEPSDLPE